MQKTLRTRKKKFSGVGAAEMKEMLEVCSDSFTYAVEAFEENSAEKALKVIEKKVEIDKGVIHQIIIQYIKAIIPKKMNEYHLYMDLSDCYFKENVDLSQFEYVKTYIFDLQDYQSPYVKKKYKQLQNTKLHLYIRRLSL